jgi:hypothetical protein
VYWVLELCIHLFFLLFLEVQGPTSTLPNSTGGFVRWHHRQCNLVSPVTIFRAFFLPKVPCSFLFLNIAVCS